VDPDRRRSGRLAFAGVAELSVAEPSRHIIAAATTLSRFGCFIKTAVSFVSSREVNVRITSEEDQFSASGEVIYELPGIGIGVAFGPLSLKDQTILEHWLSEPRQMGFKDISDQRAVRIRMAFLNDFPVELTCPECQHKSLARISALKCERSYTFPCGHTWERERFVEDIATAERDSDQVIRKMVDPK